MIKIFFTSVAVALISFAADATLDSGKYQEYDNMFLDLSKPRIGLGDNQISSLPDPFYTNRTNEAKAPAKVDNLLGYQLLGIMGNKVKLNERWYALGDDVGSYKVVQINSNSVIIANNQDEKVEIKLKQGNKNVTITYK